MEAEVWLSRRCCITSPFLLLDVPNYEDIKWLDISGCMQMDPTEVIDIVKGFKSLTKFTFRDCVQFTAYHLQRIVDLGFALEFIDGSGAGHIDSTMAMGMVCKLPKLKVFWVMPDACDLKLWEKLVFDFSYRVSFGQHVMRLVPARRICNVNMFLPEM